MRADLAICGGLALIFGLALALTTGFRWQVGLAPALAAGLGLILVLLQALRSWRERSGVATALDRTDLREIAWFLTAVLAVVLLGFAWGGGLFVFAYVLADQRGRGGGLWVAPLCGLAVPATVELLFLRGLDLRLYAGLLFD